MNSELLQRTNEWLTMDRSTRQLRDEAECFYEEKLVPLIELDYIERSKTVLNEQVRYLVVTVGTSYEPIVLNIGLFHPEKILFLHTKETVYILEKIVSSCNLSSEVYECHEVGDTDALEIYKVIKKSYMEWGRPDTIGVDFTGGTKVMSAAAAMAGAILNLEMVYVGSTEYLRDLRKPSPGSEILFRIDNPIVVFGDLEIEKAMSLFEEHNYSGVCEKLDPLLKQIPDEKVCEQLRYIIQIAQIYEQWDALFFVEASKKMNVLVMWLERACRNNGTVLMGDMLSALREQKEILKRLSTVPESIKENKNMNILKNKDVIFALMFTLLQSAMVREKQEKFDMATLLFYRLLEMMEQRRLALYELFVARPDYNKLIYNKSADRRYHGKSAELQEEELRKRVVEIRKELFGRANNYLQDPVSLLEGFILLYALKDEIVCSGRDGGIIRLKNIRQKVSLRNNSIFAHGLGPVEQGDYKRFRDFVVDMFKILCQIEGIDFMHYMTMMTWVNPAESRYYTLGVEN